MSPLRGWCKCFSSTSRLMLMQHAVKFSNYVEKNKVLYKEKLYNFWLKRWNLELRMRLGVSSNSPFVTTHIT